MEEEKPQNPVMHAGNTAVITGGASGIGLALARKCAGYGMNVVICDNNVQNLKAATESVKGKGKVEGVEIDVSKVEDYEKLKGIVEKDFGGRFFNDFCEGWIWLSLEGNRC